MIGVIECEQDTAKSTRSSNGSVFVDLNRAGSGLMEIVTEADMRYAEQGSFWPRIREKGGNLTSSVLHTVDPQHKLRLSSRNCSPFCAGWEPVTGTWRRRAGLRACDSAPR